MSRIAIAIPAYDAAYSVGSVVSRVTRCPARRAGHRRWIPRRHRGCREGGRRRSALVCRKPRQRRGAERRVQDPLLTRIHSGRHRRRRRPASARRNPPALELAGRPTWCWARATIFSPRWATVRRFSNRLSSRAISWAAGQPFSDVQTGFRLYTRDLIERTGFPETGFEAESAVVVRAARRGLRVASTPSGSARRMAAAPATIGPFTDSLRIAAGVLRARYVRPT